MRNPPYDIRAFLDLVCACLRGNGEMLALMKGQPPRPESQEAVSESSENSNVTQTASEKSTQSGSENSTQASDTRSQTSTRTSDASTQLSESAWPQLSDTTSQASVSSTRESIVMAPPATKVTKPRKRKHPRGKAQDKKRERDRRRQCQAPRALMGEPSQLNFEVGPQPGNAQWKSDTEKFTQEMIKKRTFRLSELQHYEELDWCNYNAYKGTQNERSLSQWLYKVHRFWFNCPKENGRRKLEESPKELINAVIDIVKERDNKDYVANLIKTLTDFPSPKPGQKANAAYQIKAFPEWKSKLLNRFLKLETRGQRKRGKS